MGGEKYMINTAFTCLSTGVVVSIKRNYLKRKAIVTVKYAVGPITYTTTDNLNIKNDIKVGDKIRVLYDSNNHRKAILSLKKQ